LVRQLAPLNWEGLPNPLASSRPKHPTTDALSIKTFSTPRVGQLNAKEKTMINRSTNIKRINAKALIGALICMASTFSLGLMMLAGTATIA
jgi:hypothetical protein